MFNKVSALLEILRLCRCEGSSPSLLDLGSHYIMTKERTTLPNKYLLFRVFSTRRLADSIMPSNFIHASRCRLGSTKQVVAVLGCSKASFNSEDVNHFR